jgi:5'-nucleotidase
VRQYKVIVNNFLADGGDGFTVFKQGTERMVIGKDLDALEAYLRAPDAVLSAVKKDRVRRSD